MADAAHNPILRPDAVADLAVARGASSHVRVGIVGEFGESAAVTFAAAHNLVTA